MRIELLNKEHFSGLFEFEKRNKQWFEQYVSPRPSSYHSLNSFQEAMGDLIEEHEIGIGYYYVVLSGNQIVGRVNLVDIQESEGDLGYRICESMVGKGVASFAVSQLIELARDELGLKLITAKAAINNPASMRVLEKVGFKKVSTEKTAFVLNGETLVFKCFELSLNG